MSLQYLLRCTYISVVEEKANTPEQVWLRKLKRKDIIMFETLKARYASWNRYNRTVAELSALSHRELEDIGFAPWEIKAAARKAAR
jgi:uncharacterized protein YjiS (DUF1127 family)